MTKRKSDLSQFQLGKLEMSSLIGGNEPAPSTLTTEHVAHTYYGPWGLFVDQDVNGDSYPDDCCE
ncbi:MAG TPA: hypothetical protein VGD40_21150 [Chryseosolibacter sp.]